MRKPNPKETGSFQSEFLAEAARNWLRWHHGTRLTEPRPCPDCGEQNYRKHDFKERIFAMLVTEDGFEEMDLFSQMTTRNRNSQTAVALMF